MSSGSRRMPWDTADGTPPPELAEALRIADDEDGSAEQVARLAARLVPLVGPLPAQSVPPAAPAAPIAAPAAAGGAGATSAGVVGSQLALVKVIAGTVLGVAVAGGTAVAVWPHAGESAGGTTSAAPHVAQAVPGAMDVPSVVAKPEPAEIAIAPESASNVDRGASPGVHRAPQPLPSAEALSDEARLVGEARAALATDAARTLRLTAVHGKRYPSGALAHEREVLAISALIRLGKADDARSRLERFRKAFPSSPHVVRFERTLGAP